MSEVSMEVNVNEEVIKEEAPVVEVPVEEVKPKKEDKAKKEEKPKKEEVKKEEVKKEEPEAAKQVEPEAAKQVEPDTNSKTGTPIELHSEQLTSVKMYSRPYEGSNWFLYTGRVIVLGQVGSGKFTRVQYMEHGYGLVEGFIM